MRHVLRLLLPMCFVVALVAGSRVAYATCGDGVVDGGEVCDPGAQGTGPCCQADCTAWMPTDADCFPPSVSGCTTAVGRCLANHICNTRSINGHEACSTVNLCYVGECINGVCANQAPAEDDGNPCTNDFCDQSTGQTSHTNVSSGTTCDTDARQCTPQTCDGNGNCSAPVEITCPLTSHGVCQQDKCQEPGMGHPTTYCAVVASPENTVCDINPHDCKIDRCEGNGGCTKHNLNADNGTACWTNYCYVSQCNGNGACKTDGYAPRPAGTPCNPSGNVDPFTMGPIPDNDAADADPCTLQTCQGSGASTQCVQTDGLAAGTPCNSDTNVCTIQTCEGATAATRACTVSCATTAQACSVCGAAGHCGTGSQACACVTGS